MNFRQGHTLNFIHHHHHQHQELFLFPSSQAHFPFPFGHFSTALPSGRPRWEQRTTDLQPLGARNQFHPPEISLLRDFCGTRSTFQKIKSENVATKKRFQGKILRFFNPKINEHATNFPCISCISCMFHSHLLEFLRIHRALSKQYLIVGRAASIRWVLVITLGSWRIQVCLKTAPRQLKNYM